MSGKNEPAKKSFWVKPVGVSVFHLMRDEVSICGRNFVLDGRELVEIEPGLKIKSRICEECKKLVNK